MFNYCVRFAELSNFLILIIGYTYIYIYNNLPFHIINDLNMQCCYKFKLDDLQLFLVLFVNILNQIYTYVRTAHFSAVPKRASLPLINIIIITSHQPTPCHGNLYRPQFYEIPYKIILYIIRVDFIVIFNFNYQLLESVSFHAFTTAQQLQIYGISIPIFSLIQLNPTFVVATIQKGLNIVIETI